MRIRHLSKSQQLTTSPTSQKLNIHPKFHQLFRQSSFKILHSPLQANKNLKSRHIFPEAYSLPFQANSKLFFHAPPHQVPKKSRKKR